MRGRSACRPLDAVAPAAGEQWRARLGRRGRFLEQVALVAVAVFEVAVEQLGVDVVQEFGGGGGVEGDLPCRPAEWGAVCADGPCPLASRPGFGEETGPQPKAGAGGVGRSFAGLVQRPVPVEGEGQVVRRSAGPGPARWRGRTFTVWARSVTPEATRHATTRARYNRERPSLISLPWGAEPRSGFRPVTTNQRHPAAFASPDRSRRQAATSSRSCTQRRPGLRGSSNSCSRGVHVMVATGRESGSTSRHPAVEQGLGDTLDSAWPSPQFAHFRTNECV